MIYKESKEDLLRQGLIKTCPVDWKAINNLMKRAYADLETAERIWMMILNVRIATPITECCAPAWH